VTGDGHLDTPSRAAGSLLAEGSLPRAWARRWAAHPDAHVLHDGRWITAANLEERTRTVSRRLVAAGIRFGDRVLVSAQPGADLVVAHVAALRLGAVVVPVSPAYGEQELTHVVRSCAPAAAILDDGARAAWMPPGCLVTSPEVPLPDGPDVELDAAAPGDPALLMHTSGTSGPPKVAVLSHANLLAGAESVRRAWRWTPEDRLVLALPLFHVHGLAIGLHGTLLAGASAVLRPRFAPDDVLAAVRDHGATLFFGVPTMYSRLVASTRVRELSRLRLAVSGSAPLPREVFEAVAEHGATRILERYGMTETLLTASNPDAGDRRPGTVGLPLPGAEVRLAQDTEIQVRGPSVMRGYLDRPDATAEAFTADGWFRTGDLGRLDEAGYLRIVGRSKELVITGGYNVHPSEVEDVLRTHPAVRDAAVIGVTDDDLGERVIAFVEASDVTGQALVEFAGARLAPYKRPREVVTVDALPRNALGKVSKAQLSPAAPSEP
jgi:malonyl-CoA/methylmalonyl-CoA synthetase